MKVVMVLRKHKKQASRGMGWEDKLQLDDMDMMSRSDVN